MNYVSFVYIVASFRKTPWSPRKEKENNKICFVLTLATSWTRRGRCTKFCRFAAAVICDIGIDGVEAVLGKPSGKGERLGRRLCRANRLRIAAYSGILRI